MAKYSAQTRERARVAFVIENKSFQEVSEEQSVAKSTLVSWSNSDGWMAQRDEHAANIRHDVDRRIADFQVKEGAAAIKRTAALAQRMQDAVAVGLDDLESAPRRTYTQNGDGGGSSYADELRKLCQSNATATDTLFKALGLDARTLRISDADDDGVATPGKIHAIREASDAALLAALQAAGLVDESGEPIDVAALSDDDDERTDEDQCDDEDE